MDAKMRRGQVTIFVIISVVIVAIIALFFLLGGVKVTQIFSGDIANPQVYLEGCIKENVENTVSIMSSQGGYLENDLNVEFLFDDEKEALKISFLCYTEEKYANCVNQEPVLIGHLEKEIKDEIKDDVQECYNSLVENLEKRSETVESDYTDFDIMLSSGKIEVIIDGELSISDKGSFSNQDQFSLVYPSQLYDLGILTQRIIEEESGKCYFDTARFMVLYPDVSIERFDLHTGESIYSLEDKKTENRFRFAIRNCVLPAGV